MRPEFYYLAAAVVGVLGTGRFIRLVTADEFPPTEWLRLQWAVRTGEKWGKLLNCLWCFSPYATAVNLAWALLSDLHWTWWVANGWMAASYAASWVVFHDEDEL